MSTSPSGASVQVNSKGDPMKNGSVQRASKRSYMDEATLASVTKALESVRGEVARAEAESIERDTAINRALDEQKVLIDEFSTDLCKVMEVVALLSGELSDLRERVAATASTVVAGEIEAAPEGTIDGAGVTTEPTCDHGFIGACAECDGSGQTPENDAA